MLIATLTLNLVSDCCANGCLLFHVVFAENVCMFGYYIVLAPAYYAGACFFFLCRCWSYFVMQILVYDFRSDACLFSWCQSLLVVLVLMFACFLVLILAYFSCVDGCFLFFVMSKLVLVCYADSRLRFVLACFPCLMLVLAFFPFADARLLVIHILACISCVDSCLVF